MHHPTRPQLRRLIVALDGRHLCVPEFTSVTFEAPAGAELRSRIIDVSSGRDVLDFGEEIVAEVIFNPQGVFPADRYVAVNVNLARVDLYDVVEALALVRLPRSLVTRQLTPQECATFLITDCS